MRRFKYSSWLDIGFLWGLHEQFKYHFLCLKWSQRNEFLYFIAIYIAINVMECSPYSSFIVSVISFGRVLILKQGRAIQTLGWAFQTLGWAFQTLGRTFRKLGWASEALRRNQKLGSEFVKFGRVFVLQHGPCCPNQPW